MSKQVNDELSIISRFLCLTGSWGLTIYYLTENSYVFFSKLSPMSQVVALEWYSLVTSHFWNYSFRHNFMQKNYIWYITDLNNIKPVRYCMILFQVEKKTHTNGIKKYYSMNFIALFADNEYLISFTFLLWCHNVLTHCVTLCRTPFPALLKSGVINGM